MDPRYQPTKPPGSSASWITTLTANERPVSTSTTPVAGATTSSLKVRYKMTPATTSPSGTLSMSTPSFKDRLRPFSTVPTPTSTPLSSSSPSSYSNRPVPIPPPPSSSSIPSSSTSASSSSTPSSSSSASSMGTSTPISTPPPTALHSHSSSFSSSSMPNLLPSNSSSPILTLSEEPHPSVSTTNTNTNPWKPLFTCFGIPAIDAEFYSELFFENAIEISQLDVLTDEFLTRLGVSKAGHRLKILAQKKAEGSAIAAFSFEDLLEELQQLRSLHDQFNTRISELESRLAEQRSFSPPRVLSPPPPSSINWFSAQELTPTDQLLPPSTSSASSSSESVSESSLNSLRGYGYESTGNKERKPRPKGIEKGEPLVDGLSPSPSASTPPVSFAAWTPTSPVSSPPCSPPKGRRGLLPSTYREHNIPSSSTTTTTTTATTTPEVTSPRLGERERLLLEDVNSLEEPKKISTTDLKLPVKTRLLIDLLLEHHSIALAIMDTTPPNETDSIASSVLHIFDSQRSLTNLLLSSIDHEVTNASLYIPSVSDLLSSLSLPRLAPLLSSPSASPSASPSPSPSLFSSFSSLSLKRPFLLALASKKTLFRANSIHSKVLSAHAKMVGHYYLRQTLGAYVNLIIAEAMPLEVDPTRLKPGETLPENQKNLKDMTRKFVQGLQRSIDIVPLSFRDICRQLNEKVSNKFPESNGLVAVGSFFFLRYACPAVINPIAFGLTQVQPSPNCQRGLTLVAKILQNLSNCTKFNEPYMQFMNNYLLELQPTIHQFCSSLAEMPSVDHPDHGRHITIPVSLVEQSASSVFRVTQNNFEKIAAFLGKHEENRQVLESLATVVTSSDT